MQKLAILKKVMFLMTNTQIQKFSGSKFLLYLQFLYLVKQLQLQFSKIKLLNPTKAYGFDKISICMIQLCEDSITLPLVQIFESSLSQRVFPDTWKMAKIITVHKKEARDLVKNYRPISLLPIFAKVFEKFSFNSLFFHFHNSNLFIKCQSMVTLAYPNFFP